MDSECAFLTPSLPSLLPRSAKGPELTTPFTEGASITEGQEGWKGKLLLELGGKRGGQESLQGVRDLGRKQTGSVL